MRDDLGRLRNVLSAKRGPTRRPISQPWLVEEENLSLLGATLGIELEVEGIEVAVGPYWADILARDSELANSWSLRTSFEKTDHDHLGKSITLAL